MDKSRLDKVNFNIIRYSNCWEDADLLLDGLNPREGTKHLSIASAGDNSFSLLSTNPEVVVAVDLSPVQIYLVELKKAAIKNLDRLSYLEFVGFTGIEKESHRWTIYNEIRNELSSAGKNYWDVQKEIICRGIIYSGKFEKYFRIFSSYVLPLIHSKKTIRKLLSNKDEKEQNEYYNKIWNTWIWKLFFKVFFSRTAMGLLGRDPVFLDQVEVNVGDFIYNKTEQHLGNHLAQQNHMLEFALVGKFQNSFPHYVKEENYSKIKNNIDRLHTMIGPVQKPIEHYGKMDYFNLSNIFEYLNKTQFSAITKIIVQAAKPEARLMYWNLMVKREMSEICSELVPATTKEIQNLDKGFFYQQSIVEQKVH